ncbi:MAG: NAD-dependent epimerase/dehydratase family protein [Chitinophagia bacterium]|nr:NAD-dependent epimerase/dehydratase family protein [Chitinophagia bacterium]
MILVTGGTGLVGSHLLQQLVAAGKKVRAIYRSAIPVFPGADGVEWVKGDILDLISIEQALQGVQQVFHCAAIVSFNPKRKDEMHLMNVQGTGYIVNACLDAGVQKLLFVSSVAALGRIRESEPINESMNWSPETSNSEYGKTKYLAEMEVWRGIAEGLPAVIVNPVIILGAGDWNGGSSKIFQSAYNEFPWYTSGSSGFVDVKDVARAMICLMDSDQTSKRYIVSGENRSYKEIFTLIAKGFQKKPPSRKVNRLISELVWRWEAIKGWVTGNDPLLTKETAATARARVEFDNSRMLIDFPDFRYTPLETSIQRICNEFKVAKSLK